MEKYKDPSNIDERIAKYSKIVDVYKEQNTQLRQQLNAAEAELKMHRSIREMFSTTLSEGDSGQEITKLREKLC